MNLGNWLSVALLLASSSAFARVFDYKNSNLAAYVRGTGGITELGRKAFDQSSGTGVRTSGSAKYGYGGEVGAMIGLSPNVHVRIGGELIQPQAVNTLGTNSAATQSYYHLNSNVSVFNPNLSFEWAYKIQGSTRYFVSAGAGYAFVLLINKYLMTTAGTSQFGLQSFNDSMKGNAVSYKVSTGIETLFTDNVTFAADIGYLYLPVKKLVYTDSVQNFISPRGVTAGSKVVNANGTSRAIDLSGITVGVSFRFYLNFL